MTNSTVAVMTSAEYFKLNMYICGSSYLLCFLLAPLIKESAPRILLKREAKRLGLDVK